MGEAKSITVTICMGSSCFSRGNNQHVQTIQRYITEHQLDARVALAGSRCEGKCMQGPNIRIDDVLYHDVDAETLLKLLDEHLPHR